jgi:hypothetical protein
MLAEMMHRFSMVLPQTFNDFILFDKAKPVSFSFWFDAQEKQNLN